MASVVEDQPTGEKPELVLHSPAFKALGTFLVMGIMSGILGLYEVFAWFKIQHDFDEFTIVLLLMSSVGFLSIVIGNVLTRRTLVVTTRGFAYAIGKHVEACRWDEIADVRRTLYRNPEHELPRATYWVRDCHGREFKFHDFRLDHTDCFGEWFLIPRIRERLLEEALAKFDAGEEVPFGPFRVSEQGLHYKTSQLAWNEIENLEADLDGDFVVRKRGRLLSWAEPGAKVIPNLFVMLELIQVRVRNRVLVKNTILEWWSQLPQPLWHRDFGGVAIPTRERPWLQSRAARFS